MATTPHESAPGRSIADGAKGRRDSWWLGLRLLAQRVNSEDAIKAYKAVVRFDKSTPTQSDISKPRPWFYSRTSGLD